MRIELIIFDCDGVLIDSEGVASEVVAKELSTLGWKMATEEAMALFLGMSISDMEPIIERRLGRKLPDGWRGKLADDLLVALGTRARAIPGAKEMLEKVRAMGMKYRIASNSSDEEMAVKFARTGMTDLTRGLLHSAASVMAKGGRPKPAPDVFADAAAAAGVDAARCVVLEDSGIGVTGAVAAGMLCYGFAPHGDGAHLKAAGARGVLRRLDELFGVLS